MTNATNSDLKNQPMCVEKLFSTLPLPESLLKNLKSLGYEHMTAIQAQSLPLMLKGGDVIARAKTGSGKTAAFGLCLLDRLNIENYKVQALVLCPTRELAEQVCLAIRRLARLLSNVKVLNLSGGIPMSPQLNSLRHGAHIIVGTPGRVIKHLEKQTLSLKCLKTLVLDEADRMLDMGFADDIKRIASICPTARQTLLFSATYPSEIKDISAQFMVQPSEIHIDSVHTQQDIEQSFYEVKNQANKFPLLKSLLLHYKPKATLIFCNTKQQTSQLAQQLSKEGFSTCALNGDMEQPDRDLAMIRFINQSCSILVATDVAARGLDIQELPAVINYDLAFESDVHLHRIGRTGRAGNKGLAISITTPADAERICIIEDKLGHALVWGEPSQLSQREENIYLPDMITLSLDAGRKDKIRPGDILGALVKDAQLQASSIGKIHITDRHSFIAVHREVINRACQHFQNGKIKGRYVSVRKI